MSVDMKKLSIFAARNFTPLLKTNRVLTK